MMKMYAVRDRLVDYFLQPFFAPSDAQALSAVAMTVNDQESKHAITLHPEHFEVWRLAELDENTGQIGGNREFLQDAASLFRGDVWEAGDPRAETIPGAPGGRREPGPIAPRAARTDQRAPQSPSQAETSARAQVDQGLDRTA